MRDGFHDDHVNEGSRRQFLKTAAVAGGAFGANSGVMLLSEAVGGSLVKFEATNSTLTAYGKEASAGLKLDFDDVLIRPKRSVAPSRASVTPSPQSMSYMNGFCGDSNLRGRR